MQNDQLRINSGTFNGNDMPDEMKKVFPEVFKKTRDGQKIRQPIFWNDEIIRKNCSAEADLYAQQVCLQSYPCTENAWEKIANFLKVLA